MQEDSEGRPVEIPASQARQGVTGHNVRYVLAIGLAGAIAAMALIFYVMRF